MRNTFIAVVMLAVAFVALAGAPLSAHDQYGFTGTLVTVDAAKNQITLKYKENGKDETVQVALTPKTKITRGGATVAKSALQAGLRVNVRALGCEGEDLEATEIRIVPPAAKK